MSKKMARVYFSCLFDVFVSIRVYFGVESCLFVSIRVYFGGLKPIERARNKPMPK